MNQYRRSVRITVLGQHLNIGFRNSMRTPMAISEDQSLIGGASFSDSLLGHLSLLGIILRN